MAKNQRYLIGIDEVGRGPLAGPVTVAAFAVPVDFDFEVFDGVRDSKKLSSKARVKFANRAKEIKKRAKCFYAIASVGSETIDRRGITGAVRLALGRALGRVVFRLGCLPKACRVLLDGSLRAPATFTDQTTIIGGDSKVRIIALASVVAKVHRDAKMKRLAKKFPKYGFEIHKGYGTSVHVKALKKYGPSPIHRRSFIKNFE